MSVLLLAGLLIIPAPAIAQSPSDFERAARQSERIQREQQLRQNEDRERSLGSRRPLTHLEAPTPDIPEGHGEGCQQIERIEITGGEHLPEGMVEDINRKYAPGCLGVTEIQEILSDLTGYYIEKGYSTTRVYLPAQDLSKQVLHIDIIEGRVGQILREKGDEDSFAIQGAFPGTQGEVLNLRDFEQGLDQINRLQSNHATLDIAPADKVGESNITIRNKPTKRWHATLTADNYGTRGTGRNQVGATASYDNALGLNDFVSITQRKTTPFDKFDQQSSSTSAIASVPLGYTTFTGGYSYSDYNSSLTTPTNNTLLLNGDNRTVFGTIDYVLHRDQVNKVTLSGTLTKKKSRNYIEEQKLAVSSRELTVLDLGVTLSREILGGSSSFNLGYSRGLKALGALEDTPGQDSNLPSAQFNKYVLNASWYRPFTVFDDHAMTWSSQLSAQASPNTLFGSEQMSIGGIYSVRGFHEESLANDDGYFIRNDLTLRETAGTIHGQEISVNPYIALDAGAVTGRATDTPHGTLIGCAAGLSVAAGPASIDVFAGRPLKAPENMGQEGWTSFGRLALAF